MVIPPLHNEVYLNAKWTVDEVDKEMRQGLRMLKGIKQPVVTFFGSARTKKTDLRYKHCQRTAFLLAKRGYAVMSGGGPGIMEAANSGAHKAKMPSIGLQAGLILNEKADGHNFTQHMRFQFLFVRRFFLAIKSDALVFYPGGFGTLNELFEYVCLMQTGLTEKVPVVLVGKKYWQGMRSWIDAKLLHDKMIELADRDMLHYVDTCEEAVKLIDTHHKKKHRHSVKSL